jgi:hypothetical protein
LPLECSTDVRWRLTCRDMLEWWLIPQLLQGKPNVVFQHGRAPPHIHSEVTTLLNRQLHERWIGRRGSTSWPPRSADLTLLDYFLWVFVKGEIYVPPMPITLNNLKSRIRTTQIDQALLQNVWHEDEYRHCMCRPTNETHAEFHRAWKKFLSCSLKWCAFNFCVSLAFLLINVYNRSFHFNHAMCQIQLSL